MCTDVDVHVPWLEPLRHDAVRSRLPAATFHELSHEGGVLERGQDVAIRCAGQQVLAERVGVSVDEDVDPRSKDADFGGCSALCIRASSEDCASNPLERVRRDPLRVPVDFARWCRSRPRGSKRRRTRARVAGAA